MLGFLGEHRVLQPSCAPYSPNFRQDVFPETHIHPLGCLCIRTGAMGRILARGEILTRHLATRLDGYSPKPPTPPGLRGWLLLLLGRRTPIGLGLGALGGFWGFYSRDALEGGCE